MKHNIEEIEKLCASVVEYLKNHNPYASVVITDSSIKIEQTQMSIPIKK